MAPKGIAPHPYQENPNHIPDPLYMTGTVDTSGTSGGYQNDIEAVSPVFRNERARKAALADAPVETIEEVAAPIEDEAIEDEDTSEAAVDPDVVEDDTEPVETEISGEGPQEPAEATDSDPDDEVDAFDPGEHGVPEVLRYLSEADEAEAERVREAERAGKNRKTIVGG